MGIKLPMTAFVVLVSRQAAALHEESPSSLGRFLGLVDPPAADAPSEWHGLWVLGEGKAKQQEALLLNCLALYNSAESKADMRAFVDDLAGGKVLDSMASFVAVGVIGLVSQVLWPGTLADRSLL